jgi:hypothetical protein
VRRGPRIAVGLGGAAVVASLWLSWFDRALRVVVHVPSTLRAESGWRALGPLGGALVVVVTLGAVTWTALAARPPSGVWLVLAGGLGLVVEVNATVAHVARSDAFTTTRPAVGLFVAIAPSFALVLAGLILLARVRPE